MKVVVLSLLLALPMLARAAEPPAYAYVSALQPPAWVEQNGQRSALTASDAIVPGRHYSTGGNGRLHITMADGSTIKLGENSAFELPTLQLRQDNADSVLKGAFKLRKGAFRYTALTSSFVRKRELDLYVGAISIGIDSPDIWGKSDVSQDLACLLHGKIKVTSAKQAVLAMDQINSVYLAPHGQSPNTMAAASPEQLKTWVSQTELADHQPALQSNGAYSVLVAVYLDEGHARAILADINQKGYPAILRTEKRGETPVFNIVIEGLNSAQSAATYAEILKKPLYLKNPRVLAPNQRG